MLLERGLKYVKKSSNIDELITKELRGQIELVNP